MPNRNTTLVISLDTDWAPEWTVVKALEELADAGLAGTIFATHDYPLLRDAAGKLDVEIGLHPRISGDIEDLQYQLGALRRLHGIYPNAVSVRTHGLAQSTNLLRGFFQEGLVVDSSLNLFGLPSVSLVQTPWGMVRAPVSWSDAAYLISGGTMTSKPWMATKGLCVLNFHPIHLALNTTSWDQYCAFKEKFPDIHAVLPDQVAEFKLRSGKQGIHSIWMATLRAVRSARFRVVTMRQLGSL